MHDLNRKKGTYLPPMDDAYGGGSSTMQPDHTTTLCPQAWFHATYTTDALDYDGISTEDFDTHRLGGAGSYKAEKDLRGLAYLDYTRP